MLNKLFGILFLLLFINYVHCSNTTILNLKEGSNCTYEEDKPGKCVNFFKCEHLIIDMPEKKYPPVCSLDGNVPIVCCTSCKLIENINDAVKVSSGFIQWKNGKTSHDKCLEYSRHALGKCYTEGGPYLYWNKDLQCTELRSWAYYASGGTSAKKGEMPHMALLGYGSDLESVQWLCGGTLISDKFILTAAHCTMSDLLGPVTYAALGILSRDDPDETWQRHKLKTIITHPEYNPPAKYHDIALLETEERVRLGALVIPGCLPGINDYVNDPALVQKGGGALESNLRLTAAGWGATKFRSALANTLQVIKVRGFTEEECKEHYPPHSTIPQGFNKTTQLCFGDKEKAVDTCEGDSGGPLQLLNSYCMFTILGVTSFGRACGFAGNAGIYTRVVHYVPWIEEIIWK